VRTVQLLAGSLALLALSCGTPQAPPVEARKSPLAGALEGQDCLIIVLDALHADWLGCYGNPRDASPAIDALARRGTVFERAWSPSSWTLPSTTSLFTGVFQETHGVLVGVEDYETKTRLASHATTLAELFRAGGYDTAAYTQNEWVSSTFGLQQGFARFENWIDRDDLSLAERVAERHAGRGAQPKLTYVHFRRPHEPYDASPEFVERFADPNYTGPVSGRKADRRAHNSGEYRLRGADLRHYQDLYLANICQVDRSVARLLESVDRNRTLIVVLSDHGEAFDQHGRVGHNWYSYEEYIHVPLILAHPRLPEAFRTSVPAMTLDLVPTLLELFAIDAGDAVLQGASLTTLLDEGPAPAPRNIYSSARVDWNQQQWAAVFDGHHKLLRQYPSGAELLFDLEADPTEQVDLSRSPRLILKRLRMRRLLNAWKDEQEPLFVEEASDQISEESLERLRSLGYLD
jgi:arylsulfatase A-like enzyme